MKRIILSLIFTVVFVFNCFGQCNIPQSNNNSGCAGVQKPISARSPSSDNVTFHRWYTSPNGGSPISGVTQQTIPYNGHISTLNRSYSATTTYYVASVCSNGSETSQRKEVTFTVTPFSNISIQVGPNVQPIYCPGDNVTLSANGGSNYKWRLNNINSNVLSTSTSYSPTQSGKYFLTGTNTCGSTQTTSIDINFESPATPSILTSIQNCGSTTLRRGTPPSGVVWHWQTTADGTSTLNNTSATLNVTSGTVRYLRARREFTDCWSEPLTINYNINNKPSVPSSPTITNNCGSTILTKSSSPSNVTYYWQNSSSGISTSSSASNVSITLTSGNTYYLRAKANDSDCWSTARTITYSITEPNEPNAVNGFGCGGSVEPISAQSLINEGVTAHNWYTSSSGGNPITGISQNVTSGYLISTLNENFTATTTYYVAAVCNGVESERTPVTYTVEDAPYISINVMGGAKPKYCQGQTVNLESSNGSSNVKWRKGTETSSIISTLDILPVTTSGTYFLTANRSCGAEQTKSITINFDTPDTPTLASNVSSCGSVTLTQGDTNTDDQKYYWQTVEYGTETTDFALTKTFSSNGTIYLRSKFDNTDCWGPPLEVFYEINGNTPQVATSSNEIFCGADTAVDLIAAPGAGADTIRWFTAAEGGTLLATNNYYRVSGLTQDTTYYAESYNTTSNCAAATRLPVVASASPPPSAIQVDDEYFCNSGTVTFQASLPANADDVRWYDSNGIGAQLLGTGPSFTTPLLTESTIYYVKSFNTQTGCSSFLKTVNAVLLEENIWYADIDNDGLGDPASATEPMCERPIGYVGNNNDECPLIYSTTNQCSYDPQELNYVYTRVYQVDGFTDNTTIPLFNSSDNIIQNIDYIDGLGRLLQNVAIDQSPNKNDIITHVEYDVFGRMENEWLPYAASDTNLATLRVNSKFETENYYNTEKYEYTQNPYSQKHFEPSPLNRVLKQAAPGNDWALNENGEDHAIEFAYDANEANEVRLFNVNFVNGNTEQPELAEDNFYEAGQLYKNITRDENHSTSDGKNHTTEEFTDKQGRVVLKRTYADVTINGSVSVAEPHDTYYVYDDYGNLTFVLPPKMEATTTGLSTLISNMDALGYQYKYDHRNRLVEKQIPGKVEEYIVYNKLDQPILTQDANLRENGEWLFTKYDAFGRVAYTGIATLGTLATVKTDIENSSAPLWVSQTGTSTAFGGVTGGVFYSSNTYPNVNIEILTINYYDNYNARPPSFPTSIVILDSDSNETYAPNVKGLPTVSKVKVLENDDWITSLSYYDEKGRAVYSYSENSYLGSVDIIETALDFVGKPLKTRTEHRRGGNTIVTIDNFTYDHVGRLLSQIQCIGDATMGTTCESAGGGTVQNILPLTGAISTLQIAGQSITVTEATLTDGAHLKIDPNGGGSGGEEELIVFNSYDELGQLQAKKVGGTPGTNFNSTLGLQTVDYDYNVRGWLKGINDAANLGDDLFAFEMNYNTSEHGGTALFNGNIAETEWKTANDNQLRWYHYAYDPLNRLKAGVDNSGNYNMTTLYDKNGNITELNRNGHTNDDASSFGPMDRLSYEYDTGNKLLKVTDIGRKQYGFIDGDNTDNDYNYDANGNMVSDKNKGIFVNDQDAITYNHLNLPVQIRVFGSPISGTVNYVYDATGVKLNKEVSGTSSGETEYAGNYIYEKLTNGNSELQFFSHPEGYVSVENGVYKYVYEYKDHLGNTRLSYTDENNDNEITVSTDPMVTEIVKESNYYPFGLEHKGYNNVVSSNANSVASKFKFQGVEHEEALGLDLYEMDFRNYDPTLGRFTAIDPVTHHSMSPYVAFDNNPIFWVDPSGADATDPIKETNRVISSRVDEHNVTHITQTTTTTTTTTNDDGSVSVSYSSGSITNTVDANGKVTNGSSVTTTSGTISKDADGNVSASDPTSLTRSVNDSDNTSALGEYTGVVSGYNSSNDGVYNKDKINELASKTTNATRAGVAVLSIFGPLDNKVASVLEEKLGKKGASALGLVGVPTSLDGATQYAGSALTKSIGENNGYMMIYGVEQVRNGVTLKKMKTPSNLDGNRKRDGPTSFQDLWKGIKSIFN
ncbi:Ig-like domain-containing protein [Maribacter dokdonensis]|uniref:Ig-like domain-containing protein n=1 Tax=Maribacter dokdonensis TaxID=320912 RepID=UPI002AB014E5|nr:DUF6443 domain-containing protein [Maribacter dokdonensis]